MTLVEKLVRSYSPSGHETETVDLFLDELAQRNYRVHRDDVGNAIGVIGKGSVNIYLVGHIDTVPGEIPVRLEDGTLYGRGSVDAKGALATFAEAAGVFANSDTIRVTVIGCLREETDSLGAQHILKTHNAPDYVVIGEPGGWEAITLGYRGCFGLDYERKKPRVHRGMPIATPAEEAVAFYQSLCELFPNRGDRFGDISFKLTQLNTLSSGNHEAVKMHIDVRIPITFDPEDFNSRVMKLKKDATVTIRGFTPAVMAEKRNALVRAFLGGIRAHGGKPQFKYKTGTSDMNLLNKWGCPIVTYGPGDSSLDHTPDEHLKLEEYQRAIRVLREALKKLERNTHES
ncbi:MAG: [LysW]-lysine hydrolase [FCB group bacterium]|nr:[LysW]-lysine hydrolase [FCB group bacterium]